jgi:hypothetical protein
MTASLAVERKSGGVTPERKLYEAFGRLSGRTPWSARNWLQTRGEKAQSDLIAMIRAHRACGQEMALLRKMAPLLAEIEATEESLTPIRQDEWEAVVDAYQAADVADDKALREWCWHGDDMRKRRLVQRVTNTMALARRFLSGLHAHGHPMKGAH